MVNMKKLKGNLLKVKKVLFNKKGQLVFSSSILSNKSTRFYQFISKRGS
jgi:hypothetical protein